jgi:hypothetical protein
MICEYRGGGRKFSERFKTLRALRFLTHGDARNGAVAIAFVMGAGMVQRALRAAWRLNDGLSCEH